MHWKTRNALILYFLTANSREFHDLKVTQGLGFHMYLAWEEYANCRMDVAE